MKHTLEYTLYLSDSSLAAVEEVLEPCEADSGSVSSSPLSFTGETAAGSLNLTVWAQDSGLLPAAAELVEGGFVIGAVPPAEGPSSSESELTSWWVYWWISFSLRIIWRLGKGRTPNLHRGASGICDGQTNKQMDSVHSGPALPFFSGRVGMRLTDLFNLFLRSGVSMSE